MQEHPRFYVNGLMDLHRLYMEELRPMGIPLVINTCGWIRGLGMQVMLDLIRMMAPQRLLLLEGASERKKVILPAGIVPNGVVVRRCPDWETCLTGMRSMAPTTASTSAAAAPQAFDSTMNAEEPANGSALSDAVAHSGTIPSQQERKLDTPSTGALQAGGGDGGGKKAGQGESGDGENGRDDEDDEGGNEDEEEDGERSFPPTPYRATSDAPPTPSPVTPNPSQGDEADGGEFGNEGEAETQADHVREGAAKPSHKEEEEDDDMEEGGDGASGSLAEGPKSSKRHPQLLRALKFAAYFLTCECRLQHQPESLYHDGPCTLGVRRRTTLSGAMGILVP